MGLVSAGRLFPRTGFRFGVALGSLKKPVGWLSACLLAVVAATAIFLGMGSRSLEAVGEDASVGNRLELWKTALQMTYENPSGFGAGRSGNEFMQWYQAIDRVEGYRTMVNSYLTFLVERGWLPFSAVILAIAAFWTWTWPRNGEVHASWRIALWGSLAAFLVSGIFSTTMEEPLVWSIPILAGLALIAFKRCAGARDFSLPHSSFRKLMKMGGLPFGGSGCRHHPNRLMSLYSPESGSALSGHGIRSSKRSTLHRLIGKGNIVRRKGDDKSEIGNQKSEGGEREGDLLSAEGRRLSQIIEAEEKGQSVK